MFSPREDDAPLRIPLEHRRESSTSLAIVALIAVVIERPDIVLGDFEEACREGTAMILRELRRRWS